MTSESQLVHEGSAVQVDCEECQRPVPLRTSPGGRPKRFCSDRCRNKFNTRKQRKTQLVHEGSAVQVGQRKRRPLTDAASDAAWALRKDIERIERIFADERFGAYEQQVAPLLRSHLSYTAQSCQELLGRIDTQQESNSDR